MSSFVKVVLSKCNSLRLSGMLLQEYVNQTPDMGILYRYTIRGESPNLSVEYVRVMPYEVSDRDYCFVSKINYGKKSPHDIDGDRQIETLSEYFNKKRLDPILIKVIEEHPDFSAEQRIGIVEIPTNVEWEITESESGVEFVCEKHRTWWLD